MIRIIFYEPDEYKKLLLDKKIHIYSKDDFERLLNMTHNEEAARIRPFRDEYSIRLLKDTYNLEFVSEDDWYSIKSPEEGRFCLTGLSECMKYALTLLYYARHGICVNFMECEEEIWKVLNTMPFDIILAANASEIKGNRKFILGVDYVIENYPLNAKKVQLNVVTKSLLGNDSYEKEGSFYKKEGQYYIEDVTLGYLDYRYFWKEHIKEIIEASRRYVKEEHPFLDKTMMCNLQEFLEKIKIDVDYFMSFNDYAESIDVYEQMRKDNEITEEEYKNYISHIQADNKEEYKKYLWMINDLKIISHLYVLPDKILCRKLPMLIVDKYSGGSYKIWGDLTFKHPEFDGILDDIIEHYYSEECERYITIVDVEELFCKAEDIQETNCGFKITKNCIEIFDHNDAIKMFADVAQEALDSGNCSISKEFY